MKSINETNEKKRKEVKETKYQQRKIYTKNFRHEKQTLITALKLNNKVKNCESLIVFYNKTIKILLMIVQNSKQRCLRNKS